MKTKDYLRKYLPFATLTFILLATNSSINAQEHRKNNQKKEKERTEYKSSQWNDRSHANDERKVYQENKKYQNNKHYDYRPEYSSKMKHDKPYYFNHPKYGRVYDRFVHNPLVFRNDRDDYYYYGNRFYTYRRGIGYCVTEPPRSVYFRQLPQECTQVYINGQMFFRNGDLFFQLSPRGYAMVPSPFGIHITARF